ncbi:MAG: hypothetical protein ACTSWN_00340 [Promethearchaeota archaeon]
MATNISTGSIKRESFYQPRNNLKTQDSNLFNNVLEESGEIIAQDYFVYKAMNCLRIINIVALGLISPSIHLDFKRIREYAELHGLKPTTMNRFPTLNLKVKGLTVILFENGKLVFTGIKSERRLYEIVHEVENILRDALDVSELYINTEIQNMVGMTICHQFIDLEELCLNLVDVIYEPEQFPAAILKKKGRKGVFLIFSNSKIICLGLRSKEEIYERTENLLKMIFPFARITSPIF